MAFIRYSRKSNGQEYACIAANKRNGKQVSQQYLGNLGVVIDKEAGVFRSKERRLFRYTLEEGYGELPEGYAQAGQRGKEQLILDFGDSYFLSQYFEKQTFKEAFLEVMPVERDTLFTLIMYRILTDRKAYCYADAWWQGNYASVLYPKARLASQRVSEFLAAAGSEEVQRAFFRRYFECLYGEQGAAGILIDSSGLPNASRMSVTQLSNHNGDISMEARLIYVIDRKTGMPIYFRYCPGNIIDVTTLCTTLAELRQYRIAIDYAIVDAGYCSEDNVKALYQNRVRFVTRLAPNRVLYKDLAKEHAPSLVAAANALRYGNRLLYMKKVPTDLYGNSGFAYIGVDVDSRNQQMKRAAFAAMDDKLSPEEADSRMSSLGLFVMISSEDIGTADILPLYYTRQQVEQVFDLGKNTADILPLRVQSEDTFRGHLMLTFLATVLLQKLQKDILSLRKKKDKTNPESALFALRNQKCKVYADEIVPQEAVKSINDLYKLFHIVCPSSIPRNL